MIDNNLSHSHRTQAGTSIVRGSERGNESKIAQKRNDCELLSLPSMNSSSSGSREKSK